MKGMTNRSFSLSVVVALSALAPVRGQSVVINEIHYHPVAWAVPPGDNPDDLSFLELVNAGATSATLDGWSISEGVTCTFPTGTTLDPGAFLLVAEDAAYLAAHVTLPPGVQVFQYAGDLAHEGELLRLLNASATVVDEVTFDDVAPWPTAPDGTGPSLELVNPSLDNSYASVWRASGGTNGTPGAVNSAFTQSPIILSETPPRNAVITSLTQVVVVFAEPVTGVVAANLTVNSSLAMAVTGSGAGPYTFTGFAAPVSSPIQVALAPGAIQDLSGNPFQGDMWIYSFDLPNVVINEIHYHPADPNGNAEFVELYNAEGASVDISNWSLVEFASPGYTFPPGTTLAADSYVVVAKDIALLQTLTGFYTPHTWGLTDSLSNGGEPIQLKDQYGIIVDRVVYADYDHDPTWPDAPDGDGPSLELVNPDVDNALAGNWYPSSSLNGTPGAQNSVATNAPRIVNEYPSRRTAVEQLASVTVVFSTPVTGVTPDDLLVAGVPATAVVPSTGPADTYTFTGYGVPDPGSVTITVNSGGIVGGGLPFTGDSWTVSAGLLVVINELHYHPADPNGDAEFIELHNAGAATAQLDGWVISDGVDYVFPTGALAPGGYLVIALDSAILQQVTGYAGALQWTGGRLANGGEVVALSDADLNRIDAVEFVDRGTWPQSPDGDGPSLELVNPRLPNEYGPAWKASTGNHGTPGAQNSVYQASVAPIITGTNHDPAIPAPSQNVLITATVIDDTPGPTVTLHYRQDQNPTIAYSSTPMLDDGFHGDGAAGDNVYGAIVSPGLVEGQRLDFTIRATDGTNTAAAPPGHNTLAAGQNPAQTYLCPFVNPAQLPAADFPAYHLVTTQYVRSLQDSHTETEYDATFIRRLTDGTHEIFYNVIEHYRGANSLGQHPHSFHIKFAEDQPLESEMGFEITRLLLNAQSIVKQHLGNRLFRESFGGEVPTPETQFVRLYTSPLSHGGSQNYIYINVERMDGDFLNSENGDISPVRFPSRCDDTGGLCGDDADCPPGEACVAADDGNLYRGRYNDSHLRFEGWDPAAYMVDGSGQNGYELENNEDNHDWTDLMTVCHALDASQTPDAVYEQTVRPLLNEEEWARWFALHMLLVNQEGGIYRDTGDDYYIYFQTAASYEGYNATMLPWDMDSTYGGWGNSFAQETIWRTTVPSPQRFLRSNAFAGRFIKAFDDLLNTVFQQAAMDAWIDAIPDAIFTQEQTVLGYGAGFTKQAFKNWVATRRTNVNNEIRRTLTLNGVPSSPYTNTNPVIALSGQLNQVGTHHVLVNGQPADAFSIYNATWSKQFTLYRGTNHILVQCMDQDDQEVSRATASVRYAPPAAAMRLTAPTRMVNTKTLTLKGELLDANGSIDWRIWNTLGTVSAVRVSNGQAVPTSITVFETYPAGVGGGTPPTDSIRFYNGVGSVSITLDNGAAELPGDIQVTVTASGVSASKTVTILDAAATGLFQNLSGTLSGGNLTWEPADGVIRLTGNVTVPSGQTLTILPGTLVMVNSGPAGDGTKIIVNNATLQAQGTQANPIFFFPTEGPAAMALPQTVQNNPPSWGGIDLTGSGSSSMSYVFLTGAGNNPVTGHPRPAVFHFLNSHSFTATDCVFADSPGKIMHGAGTGTYTLQRCLFSRNGIGGELLNGGYTFVAEDTWFTRIGRAEEEYDCDGDVLHIDFPGSAHLRRCVLSDCGDDMIDHSNAATPVLENCIIYDADDKVVSIGAGTGSITLTNCLVFNVPTGVTCTGAPAYLTHVTLGPNTNVHGQSCSSVIQRSILWTNSADTCCGDVDYTLVGNSDHLGCGDGNLSTDPLFSDPANRDYTLQPDSVAMAAGPTGGRIGWLGFPTAESCITDPDCDDGDVCTEDICDQGICAHNPISGCCYDASDCNDANACTDDACNAGTCAHTPDNTNPCSDGVACTNDVCSGGVCVGTDNCPTGRTCNHATGQCDFGPTEVVFQEGLSGYAGTVDTFIQSAAPDANNGALEEIRWDTSDGSPAGPIYLLLRFEHLFSSDGGPIPDGAQITLATLAYTVGGTNATGNDGDLRPALVDWTEATTYNTFGGDAGVQADEYGAASIVSLPAGATTTYSVSVLSSLQAWSADPASNRGWIVIPTNTDGVRVRSSEYATVAERPTLTVQFLAGCDSPDDCDDADLCTTDDCVGGACAFTSIDCGTQYCDPTSGTCVNCLTYEHCSDGDVCNGQETCQAGACVDGISLNCDDGVACTDHSCDPVLGCQQTDNCPPGLSCNHSTGLCESSPGFTAYNDCVYASATQQTDPEGVLVPYLGANVTTFNIGTGSPGPSSGMLLDQATGDSTGVTVTLTQNGGVNWNHTIGGTWSGGYTTNAGTDARTTFGGIADITGVVYYGSTGWWVDATFSGLDPAKTYTFATSASRADIDYVDRYTRFSISGVNSATNASTPGVQVYNSDPWQVYFNTGDNHNEGFVARWTDIDPGPDGIFAVRARAHSINQAYAFSVFMLKEESSVPECDDPTDCDDGDLCTDDVCVSGDCVNTAVDCGVQYCDPATGGCVDCWNDGHCDDALFCNGAETCTGGTCAPGSPACLSGTVCNETTDTCDAIGSPAVSAAGSRYMLITPPPGLNSVALQVTSADVPCLPRYLDGNGYLVDQPVFRSSAAWGTVYAGDEEIIPGTLYEVRADVRLPSDPENLGPPAAATTWLWGDTNDDAWVDLFDIVCVLDGYLGVYPHCTPQGVDLRDDVPDRTVNIFDIVAVLDAMQDLAYPDDDPCAGPGGLKISDSADTVMVTLAPSPSVVRPGELVSVEVFASAPIDLRGYQLAVQAVGGRLGTLVPETATFDKARPDYVFIGLESYAVTDSESGRMANVLVRSGVEAGERVYLGTYTLRADLDALGTFEVVLRMHDTAMADSTGRPIAIQAGPRTFVRVSVPDTHDDQPAKPARGPQRRISGGRVDTP